MSLYVLIVLSSLTFYNPFGLISPQLGKFLFYFFCTVGLIYANKNGISLKRINYPKTAYRMLIGGILVSILMATMFQEQSLKTTLISTLPHIFGYLTFYTLMKLNIPKERIEHAIWIFCFISMAAYVINMASFPTIVLGLEKEEYDMSRGIVRIGVMSIELMLLCFFYSINQWQITKKRKYVFLMLLTFTFIVLSVTRQYILIASVLGLLFIMQKASWSKRIGVVLACVFLFYFVIPQIPIFKAMVEVSEMQAERNEYEEEDIRIRAWRFYTHEYQTNGVTALFGNGIPSFGKSKWGMAHERTVKYEYGGNGCFTVDVGWAGFYWYFGLLATAGLFILLAKAALQKKTLERQYLTYGCISIIILAIASGPILFYHQIVSIMTILYITYGKESHSNNHPQLQQL